MNSHIVAADVGGSVFMGIIILGACYLIPTIIAALRHHKDLPAIAAINILFGWSVVGWFIAMIWALADAAGRGNQTVVINNSQQNARHLVHTAPEPTYPAPRPPAQRTTAATPTHPALQVDPDTAFWDGIANKRDPDLLEEYLVRFPTGRFAGLATNRLARLNGPSQEITDSPAAKIIETPDIAPSAPPAPEVTQAPAIAKPTAPAPTPAFCESCGAAWEPQSRFCGECGGAQEVETSQERVNV
jgi:hypothetical protein